MTAYWFVFLLPVIALLVPARLRDDQGWVVWSAFGVLLIVFVGLRDQTGGDWFAYEKSFFLHGAQPFSALLENFRDPAYYWTGWIIHRAGGTVHLLNAICATALAIGLIRFCRSLPLPWLAAVAAMPYLVIVVGMGYTRQAAAIGMVLIALGCLAEGSIRRYLIFIFIAACFHRSAVVLLPLAGFVATKNRFIMFASVAAVSALGVGVFVAEEAETLWSNYVESEYADAADGAPLRVAMNALAGALYLLFRKRFGTQGVSGRIWTFLSIGAIACVPLLAVSLTAVDRLALYLLPLQIYVAGSVPRFAGSAIGRTHIVFGVIASYASVLFVWLNFAGNSSRWQPYQSVLNGLFTP